MIDKILEKEPKKQMGNLAELDNGGGSGGKPMPPQCGRPDYTSYTAEPEDEDSMSDIADIVKQH